MNKPFVIASYIAFAVMLVGCSQKQPEPTNKAQAVKQMKPKVEALTLQDATACDRRARVTDNTYIPEQELKEAEQPKRYVEDMAIGEAAYVWKLDSMHGKVYANRYVEIFTRPQDDRHGGSKTRIVRTTDGFLLDCSKEAHIIIQDKSQFPPESYALFPIIGKVSQE